MQSQDLNNKDINKDMQGRMGQQGQMGQQMPEEDISAGFGSTINDPEEKEARRYDDWHAHKHEKHRDLKDPDYREAELHGVVGKEIHDLLEKDKHHLTKGAMLDEMTQQKKGHQQGQQQQGQQQQGFQGEQQTNQQGQMPKGNQ